MPQLALDDYDRHAFVRQLDRVRVTQLMRRQPPTDASQRGGSAQLMTYGRRRWIDEVRASALEPLHEFADTLEAHWEGVLRWHHSRINNGLLEGLNSLEDVRNVVELWRRSPRIDSYTVATSRVSV